MDGGPRPGEVSVHTPAGTSIAAPAMSTQVEFHTGVDDTVRFACRLLRKAYHRGARLLVRAPPQRLAELDRALWTFVEREFVPHLRFAAAGPRPKSAARTPIWLVDGPAPEGAPPILVNLGADAPADVSRFERVIEIVSADAEDTRQARRRWRAYQEAGLPVTHHAAAAGPG